MTDEELDALVAASNPVSSAKLAALDVAGAASDMMEAIMTTHPARSYKRIAIIGAAVAAVFALATGLAVIDGGREERQVLRLVLSSTDRSAAKMGLNAGAEASGTSDMMAPAMIRWQPTEYTFADGVDLPSGSAEAWAFVASESERNSMIDRATTAIEQLGGTPDADHVWVDDYTPYYWSYSDYARIAVSAEAGSDGTSSGSSGGGSDGASGGSTEPSPPVDCALYPKDAGCTYVEPTPPTNVPTRSEAEELGRKFFADLGLNLDDYQIDVQADVWGAYASANLLINGHNTWMGWSIGFGGDSVVTYAGGTLAHAESLGKYPLADKATILERLAEYPQIMPMMRYGVAYAYDTASPGSETSDAAEPPANTATDTTDIGTTPEPVPGTIIEPGTTVPVEPRKVEITRVELGLTQFYDVEGRTLMVPAFDLYSKEGLEVTILAVAKGYVQEYQPDDVSLPGVDEPVTIETKPPVTTEPTTPAEPPISIEPGKMPIEPEEANALVGLSEDEATKVATGNGWVVRVAQRDDMRYNLTSDMIYDRVNFVVMEGIVTEVSVG